jgi:hypothetical protein
MNPKLHNIIEFYKKSDKSNIGYFRDDFDLTSNINLAKKFKEETNLEPIIETLLRSVYKKDWDDENQSMSKHTYGHLFEDWFKDIDKKDVTYRIVNFEGEMRRLKIKKLKT